MRMQVYNYILNKDLLLRMLLSITNNNSLQGECRALIKQRPSCYLPLCYSYYNLDWTYFNRSCASLQTAH